MRFTIGMTSRSTPALQNELTLLLLKRILSVKVRDIGDLEWKYPDYPYDVRFEPLENAGEVLQDIRASGEYNS